MAKKYAERIDEAAKAASVEFDASFMPGGEIHMPPETRPAPPPPPPLAPTAESVPEFDLGHGNTPAFGLEVEASPASPTAAHATTAPEFSIEAPLREPQVFASADLQAAAAAEAPAAPPAPAAHEIDLSDWEQMTETEAPAAAAPKIDEWVEEAQFYLAQSFWKEAGAAIEKIA